MPLSLSVLGPVTLRVGPVEEVLSGRTALLLCRIAACRGGWISAARLCEVGDRPASRAWLHTNVSRIRAKSAVYGKHSLIETGPAGYRLNIETVDLDLVTFDALRSGAFDASERREPDEIVEHATGAIRLWIGEPFGSIDHRDLDRQRHDLEHQYRRLVVLGARASLESDRHRSADWVGRLHELATIDPVDESLATVLAMLHEQQNQTPRALRTLRTCRDALAEAGLRPSEDLIRLEGRLLGALPAAPFADHRSVAEGLVDAERAVRSGDHDRAHVVLTGIVNHADTCVDARDVDAWMMHAIVSEQVNNVHGLRASATRAFLLALQKSDVDTVARAASLTLRTIWPSEPNLQLIAAIDHHLTAGPVDAKISNVLRALRAAHRATAGTVDDHVRQDVDEVLYETRGAPHTVRLLAEEAWLIAHEGHPALDQQLDVARRFLVHARGDRSGEAQARLELARLQLVSGDRTGVDTNLGVLLAPLESAGPDHLRRGRALQLAGAVSDAVGDTEAADLHIEHASSLLSEWPLEQEIAMLQRWWLALDEPGSLVDLIEAYAAGSPRTAAVAVAAYTQLAAGRLDSANVSLCSLLPDEKTIVLTRDLAFTAAVAGLLQVAIAAHDVPRTKTLLAALRPYDGQLVVALNSAFVFGSTARFLAAAERSLGNSLLATATLRRGEQLERRFAGEALVRRSARRCLV